MEEPPLRPTENISIQNEVGFLKRAFAILTALCFSCVLTSAQTIAIKAGHLVDPDAGKVLADQVILIEDGKFQAIGHDLVIPAGAKVIDLSKMTVLPGLIDCHTHVADSGDSEPINVLQKS